MSPPIATVRIFTIRFPAVKLLYALTVASCMVLAKRILVVTMAAKNVILRHPQASESFDN